MVEDRPTPASANVEPATALLILALWLLCTLGIRPLMLPDEGRYTEVAWEMLRSDPLVPTLFGLPYFHKPPLTYWINAAALEVFGPGEFAARIAPALGAWLMGLGLWLDVRSREGGATAKWALGVLATMPFFFLGAQFANHDMLVAGCITMSIVCARRAAFDLHRHIDPGGNTQPTGLGWVLGAWAAAGAGVLTKGLIGIVLPALVIVPVLLWQRERRALRRLLHPAGVLVFAAIALPWFFEMQRRYPGFLDYIVVEQHLRRYTTVDFNNPQPFWFLPVALALLALPWTLWAWPASRAVDARGEALVGASRDGSRARFLTDLWWLLVVLAFFSWPRSKLVGYVLPALPALAALLAPAVRDRPRLARWFLGSAAVLCVGTVVWLDRSPPTSYRDVGQALALHRQPGEEVLFVEGHYFDVPFYARMASHPRIWSDWDDPDLPKRDHWRKELHDAARFAPQAAEVLVRTRDLPELLCTEKPLWIVAGTHFQIPAAWGEVVAVTEGRHATLWRATGTGAALCH